MARPDHSGRDLLVAVRRGRDAEGRTLRAQLEEQLRDDVRAGRLRPGEALPSSRSLAEELGVSRGVVVEAYAQLVAEGFLVARRGSATRVAERPRAPRPDPSAPAPPPAASAPVVRWDFRPESADLAAFPRRTWAAAVRRALDRAPDAALGYGDRAGAPVLRAALAGYLGRARGVAAEPSDVVVTAGMTQALDLVVRALAEDGVRRVGVEDPGFHLHRGVLERAGVEVVPFPVDAGGIVLDGLDRVDAVLVTPAHQMPTGAVLAPERRSALAAWEGWVLEDDYDGEYRYDREALGALQGLRPERTVYLGTASKTLAPGLRLGWLAAPAGLAAAVAERKGWADGGSDVVGQLALADLVVRGDLDRHLRRMRGRYRRRRDAVIAGVARRLPGAEVTGAAAGLHLLARLPAGEALSPVLAGAWARGAAVVGFEHEGRAALVLGYGNLPEPAVDPGLCAIAGARAEA